jgi:hypothetical protein
VQLELFPWQDLGESEKRQILGNIRQAYWFIRNYRGKYQRALCLRKYRYVATQKKRLLLAGVQKREILDFLACCRLQCSPLNLVAIAENNALRRLQLDIT